MTKKQFVDLLLSTPLGVIIAGNILTSTEDDLVSKDFVINFMTEWLDIFNNQELYSKNQNSDTIIDAFIQTGKNHLQQCSIRENAQNSEPSIYVSVVSEFIFNRFVKMPRNSKGTRQSRHRSKRYYNSIDPLRKKVKTPKTQPSFVWDEFELRPSSYLEGQNRLVWITQESSVGALNSSDDIRDALGLIHREKDTTLVIYRFFIEKDSPFFATRPTFCDAGNHRRFRIRPQRKVNKKNKTWGTTVDLAKIDDASQNIIDGLPERVTKYTDLYKASKLECVYLEPLKTTRGVNKLKSDNQFSKYILEGRKKSAIKADMLSCIS